MTLHFKISAVVALVAILSTSAVKAATLAPGDIIFVPATTAATNPETTGTELQNEVLSTNQPFVPAGSILFARFEVQNRVIASSTDGGMVFMPRVLFGSNVTTGNLLVDRVEIVGFGNYAIDAFYRTDGPGDRGPTTAARSADGDTLSFDFGFPLTVNNLLGGVVEESYPFALKTTAPSSENTGRLSIFARAQGDNFNTYRFDVGGLAVPTDFVSPVPLPAPFLLLIGGFGVLAGLRWHTGDRDHG